MTWHLVTTDYPPRDGGIATWSALVARTLHDAGEDVLVHARGGGPVSPWRIVPMRGRSWARWGPVWAAASVLPRLRRGDRLLCATWPLAVRLLAPARALGVPILVAYHGSDLTRPPLVPGLDAVRSTAIHLPVSAFLGGLLDAPHTVLPMPVDPLSPSHPGDALLVIARLLPTKGVDRALRLAARLGRPITAVGDGPARAELETLARDLGVRATFTGRLPREEIPWDGAWALALLSRTDPDGSGAEGLGLVMLEAAARGIPSIGARTGGIPEAASVVLDDPERDPVPTLPSRDDVRRRLAEHHGTARTLAVLRAAAGRATGIG